MTKTIKINGTKRLIWKNAQGVYVAYLDEEDIKWINSRKEA